MWICSKLTIKTPKRRQVFSQCYESVLIQNSIIINAQKCWKSITIFSILKTNKKFAAFSVHPWSRVSITFPVNIYLFKVNNRKLEKGVNMFKINNKDTKTTPSFLPVLWKCLDPEQYHYQCSKMLKINDNIFYFKNKQKICSIFSTSLKQSKYVNNT